MPIAAIDLATLVRDLLDEHAAINYDEIGRGELIQGDIMSADEEDVADFNLITEQGVNTRIDLSDGTSFRIIIEEIIDDPESSLANKGESAQASDSDEEAETDDVDRLPEQETARQADPPEDQVA